MLSCIFSDLCQGWKYLSEVYFPRKCWWLRLWKEWGDSTAHSGCAEFKILRKPAWKGGQSERKGSSTLQRGSELLVQAPLILGRASSVCELLSEAEVTFVFPIEPPQAISPAISLFLCSFALHKNSSQHFLLRCSPQSRKRMLGCWAGTTQFHNAGGIYVSQHLSLTLSYPGTHLYLPSCWFLARRTFCHINLHFTCCVDALPIHWLKNTQHCYW